VRVTQVRWHCADQAVPHIGVGRANGRDDRIGLGCQRDMDHRLGQVDPRLRQPDELHRLRRRHRGLQGGRVGHPDVLAGVND
jgi:hypothetical protein